MTVRDLKFKVVSKPPYTTLSKQNFAGSRILELLDQNSIQGSALTTTPKLFLD